MREGSQMVCVAVRKVFSKLKVLLHLANAPNDAFLFLSISISV